MTDLDIDDRYFDLAATSTTVYNSGTNTTNTFAYRCEEKENAIARGTANFAGSTGVVIHAGIGKNSYDVTITPTGDASVDAIGEIWIDYQEKFFIVYNSGANTDAFDWAILPTHEDSYNVRGESSYGGIEGVSISHTVGDTDFHVYLMSTEDPGGNLSDVAIVRKTTSIVVYNFGTATTKFRYRIVEN